MKVEFPSVRVRQVLGIGRKSAVLYEDYVAVEGMAFLGSVDLEGQAFYDEIHYVMKYRGADWSRVTMMILGVVLSLSGLVLTIQTEGCFLIAGVALMIVGGPLALISLIQLAFFKIERARVVSPRGTLDFNVSVPRSKNPLKDGPTFFRDLISRIPVVPPPERAVSPGAVPVEHPPDSPESPARGVAPHPPSDG